MSASGTEYPTGDLAGRPRDKRVGELLIEEGLISDEQLKNALDTQAQKGGKLFEVLIAHKILTKDSLHAFLSRQSGVPAIDLRNYEIPRELVPIVAGEFAREHVVLPIDKLGRLLTVGMACPLDTVTIHELEHLTGLKVKAMLCKLDDIQAKIRRYYPVREDVRPTPASPKPAAPTPAPQAAAPAAPVRPPAPRRIPPRQDAIDRIVHAGHLPVAQATLQRMVRAADDPLRSIRNVAVEAAGDPAVAAKLVSTANAAVYGMAGNVTNVYLAATLLGNPGIRAVLTATGGTAPAQCAAFSFKSFLLRSVFCAKAAAAAAQKSGRVHPPDAYTGGLLHDIGRLALAHVMAEDYARVDSGLSILDLMDGELLEFGFTHAEAGYRWAVAWGLPPIVAGAIRTHHDVEALKLDPLAATIALSTVLAEAYERSVPLRLEAFQKSPGLLAQSGLDAAAAVEIYNQTAAAIAAA